MNKKLLGFILFAVMAVFSLVYVGRSDAGDTASVVKSVCDLMDISVLQKHIPITNKANIVSKRDVHGVCEMIVDIPVDANGGVEQVSLYATPNFVIAGEMYANKSQVTMNTLNALSARKFKDLQPEIDKAVGLHVESKGKPKHTLYMFSSPSCPHCQSASAELVKILEKDTSTELKVLFYAGGEARDKSIAAVCEKMDLSTYVNTDWVKKLQQKKPMCVDGIQVVDKSTAIARKLGISGVPCFFTEKGEMIQGANMAAIKKAIQG